MISTYKGRCKRIVGVDVDPIITCNDSLDEAHVIELDGRLPLPDSHFDVIFSYAVLEHLENPELAATEIDRVLKPGGWFCAWTPNKWGYVGLGAQIVPSRLHARLLRFVQPVSRASHDVFPTFYRANTRSVIRRLFPASSYDDFSFLFNAQPSYNFGSALISRLWLAYMSLMPRYFSQGLFVFVRKLDELASSK